MWVWSNVSYEISDFSPIMSLNIRSQMCCVLWFHAWLSRPTLLIGHLVPLYIRPHLHDIWQYYYKWHSRGLLIKVYKIYFSSFGRSHSLFLSLIYDLQPLDGQSIVKTPLKKLKQQLCTTRFSRIPLSKTIISSAKVRSRFKLFNCAIWFAAVGEVTLWPLTSYPSLCEVQYVLCISSNQLNIM